MVAVISGVDRVTAHPPERTGWLFLIAGIVLFGIWAVVESHSRTPAFPVRVFRSWMFVAAVLGDAVNYQVGKYLGPKVFSSETSRLLNKKHLVKTQLFYEKYGPKTIIIARFVPLIRTFAPFVAGIGRMSYGYFAFYNVFGGLVWTALFIFGGYFFGNLPIVEQNFTLVVLAIIVLSVLPPGIEFLRGYRRKASHVNAE